MNFSSLQSSVQKFGMNQALKYLEKDPETNIPKLMNLVDKVMPEGWYGSQRKVIREQIDEKGVWYDYILKLYDLDAGVRQAVFKNFIFKENEGSFLVGYIAAKLSQTGKIGLVGGFPIPEVNRLMHAFMAGAKEVNPKVEFTVTFINSWFDPPKAKEASFAMIDKGVDVMYAERFGVSDAAKEKGKLAIGNVINTQPQYPDTVVASALWNMEPTVDRAIKLVKEGKFTAEDYGIYSTMKYKGSELAPLGTFEKKVPADIVAKVKAKEADILAGKFTVKVDDSQPKSTAK